VAINYLPSEAPDAKEVLDLIQKAGRKAIALPGDIRDERFCQELVEKSRSALNGLDILVNVAGHQQACENSNAKSEST
jgi:NAD(P)-dependent dehydrogenase (short-subunit alcohol dehydrogenase family)